MITQAGMAAMAVLLADFDYIGIGESATAESNAHTDLLTPVKRKQGTPTTITTVYTNDTYQLVVEFSSADSLSGSDTISEGGAFNAGSGGTMLFRKTPTAKTVNWDDGDTLEATATVQIEQGT